MNHSTVFDSQLYSGLFTQADMKEIWSEKTIIQSWLDFEIALASCQAELNIIPLEAAEKIAQFAHMDSLDFPDLAKATQKTGMPIKPLLEQIIIASGHDELVKSYLHWGSTTQDVLDTGQALRIKKSLSIIEKQLITLLEKSRDMALKHKNTIMVARTNAQDALPTTWGLQVSGYMMEFSRHLERLSEIKKRSLLGVFGGAIGNLSSLDKQGVLLRNRLMEKLGLTQPIGLLNGSQDHITELIQFFTLIHGSLQRIANDVELMGRAPIAELKEGGGKNSSSTMPHKNNPRISNLIQTLARLGFMYGSAAPNLMDQTDIRSASMRMISWSILPESFLCLSSALEQAAKLMGSLVIFPQKMRANFAASQNFVMSEAVMMALAPKIGRKQAYNVMAQLTQQAQIGKNLQDLLLKSEIMEYFTETEIKQACLPENYLGCNAELIEETITHINNQLQKHTKI